MQSKPVICNNHSEGTFLYFGEECGFCKREKELAVLQTELSTIKEYGEQVKSPMKERLTPRETAGILNKEVSTLASWRCKNSAPLPFHKGPTGRVYYKYTEVMKYQENN